MNKIFMKLSVAIVIATSFATGCATKNTSDVLSAASVQPSVAVDHVDETAMSYGINRIDYTSVKAANDPVAVKSTGRKPVAKFIEKGSDIPVPTWDHEIALKVSPRD